MKNAIFKLLLGLTLTLPAMTASATDYIVHTDKSRLDFSGSFQGSPFQGRFNTWQAQIRYDPNALNQAKFDVTVDLTSVTTDDKDRDSALPGKDFFNAGQFPQAHFVTTGFRKQGNQIMADGKLTLRGITRPIRLPISFTASGKNATLDVHGSIKRLDFGVGGGQYADTSVIGNDVKINAHLLLTAK
jgi:polyisoprenoid-binding protein YceI